MVTIGLESKIPNDNTEKSVHFVLTIYNMQSLQSEQGCGCKSNIASVLAEHGVTTMLAGGIGAGAINVLNKCNIEVVRGCSGNTMEIVNNYLDGKVIDSGESCMHHEHEHSHGHQCSH